MRRLFAPLSRLLVLVMALTVLAPGFGWASAGGMVSEAMAATDDSGHAAHHQVAMMDDCAGCDEHPAQDADCGERHDHCCPGHFFSHLAGQPLAALTLALPDGSHLAVDRDPQRFSSRVPEGLERPPRAVTA